jgi:hypothetical protein
MTLETVGWGYVFATLIIRFVGVFIVLGIIQICMTLSSKIISKIVDGKK